MSGANIARRMALLAAGGTAYGAATYITYRYLSSAAADRDRANARLVGRDVDGTSYVSDPNRTQTFSNIASNYDDGISKDEFVMGIGLLRQALLYFHARGTVLEVGAGTGRNLGCYPSSSIDRVILTDASDKMLAQARTKVSEMTLHERKKYTLAEADAADLSRFSDNSFDTVVDTFGLCSFDDPVAVLKELQRVCKPSGKILLLEHGRTHEYEGLSKYLDKNAERHAKNWGCVWNRDLDDIMAKASIRIESLTKWHFGTTYYVICRPNLAKEGGQHREGETVVATSSSDRRSGSNALATLAAAAILPRMMNHSLQCSCHHKRESTHTHTVEDQVASSPNITARRLVLDLANEFVADKDK